jgi:hypothetical protein
MKALTGAAALLSLFAFGLCAEKGLKYPSVAFCVARLLLQKPPDCASATVLPMTILDSLLFANLAHQSYLELLPGGLSALGLRLASAHRPPLTPASVVS